jgi:hypothetical protein
MPSQQTARRARADLRAGKRPTTAAGEFVREEVEHVRQGKHGARSTKQAIAIGLSKARRAGVPLQAPKKGAAPSRTRRQAQRDLATGQGRRKARSSSARRRRATAKALRSEPRRAATHRALSRQARSSARRRRSTKGRRVTAKRRA